MPRTEAEKKARKAYREKGKRFTVEFYPTEQALINWLYAKENKQAYIKDLIRQDMGNK